MKLALSFKLLLAAVLAVTVNAAPISHDEIVTKSAAGLRLLSLEEGAEPVWKTEDEKLELMRAKVNFVRIFFTSSRSVP
jgi:bacterial leucyl aminopeptidase